MSSADQLKYQRMKETLDKKKPTPIRSEQTPPRGHAKRPPEPIIFPKPPQGINLMTPEEFLQSTEDVPHPVIETQRLTPLAKQAISVEMRNYIAHCISRTLYKVSDWPVAEIVEMGEGEFEALCRSILEDDAG